MGHIGRITPFFFMAPEKLELEQLRQQKLKKKLSTLSRNVVGARLMNLLKAFMAQVRQFRTFSINLRLAAALLPSVLS